MRRRKYWWCQGSHVDKEILTSYESLVFCVYRLSATSPRPGLRLELAYMLHHLQSARKVASSTSWQPFSTAGYDNIPGCLFSYKLVGFHCIRVILVLPEISTHRTSWIAKFRCPANTRWNRYNHQIPWKWRRNHASVQETTT